jgi:ERCC4-type nuclease
MVLIDSREQHPFTFAGLRADARQGRRPLVVPTQVTTLPSGDYSLAGLENAVAVERKSLADLYHTLAAGRGRFERELGRLTDMEFAAVVVEADWDAIINRPPDRSRLLPKSVFRSVVALQQRFPRVHWWACPGRRFAEVATFRILERFHRDRGGRP